MVSYSRLGLVIACLALVSVEIGGDSGALEPIGKITEKVTDNVSEDNDVVKAWDKITDKPARKLETKSFVDSSKESSGHRYDHLYDWEDREAAESLHRELAGRPYPPFSSSNPSYLSPHSFINHHTAALVWSHVSKQGSGTFSNGPSVKGSRSGLERTLQPPSVPKQHVDDPLDSSVAPTYESTTFGHATSKPDYSLESKLRRESESPTYLSTEAAFISKINESQNTLQTSKTTVSPITGSHARLPTPAEKNDRVKRTAVLEDFQLWTNGRVPYVFTDSIARDAGMRSAVLESIAHLTERTCLQFVRYNRSQLLRAPSGGLQRPPTGGLLSNETYVEFIRDNQCQSSVGMSANPGAQNVSLATECAYPEMIVHELGHLVGLWHEHARYDRDNHVALLWSNIPPHYAHNFDKQRDMRLLAPYDLSSMMHYNLKTFSGTGQNVIRAMHEDLEFLIGYRRDLSFYDGYTLNKLYDCAGRCGASAPQCENGAYLNKECVCVCPRQLTGKRCHLVKTDPVCGGVIEMKSRDQKYIFSPNFPRDYPTVTDCAWLIKSPVDTVMWLELEDFQLEEPLLGRCRDSLEIRYHYIGIEQGPTLCGDATGLLRRNYTSTTNRMIVKFHSNSQVVRRGFQASISVLPKRNCASSPCLNGAPCQDIAAVETFFCDCPTGWIGPTCERQIVHGRWSDWSAWSGCSAQCGRETRARTCLVSANGGADCAGAAEESRRCREHIHLCHGQLYCDFGTESSRLGCGVVQEEEEDRLDWDLHQGATPSIGTGPSGGHTTGGQEDVYLYLEASLGRPYDNALFWLPVTRWTPGRYCLQFFYHMFGASVGTLRVQRRTATHTAVLWQRSGDQGDRWHQGNINLMLYHGVMIGIEAIKGDAFESDIAVDDISLSPSGCHDPPEEAGDPAHLELPACFPLNFNCRWRAKHRKRVVCRNGTTTHRVGSFTHRVDACRHSVCFCNHDGRIDCPAWDVISSCHSLDGHDDSLG